MVTRLLDRLPVPRAWSSAWDRLSPREHRLVVAALALILFAIAWSWIWQPILDDTVRARGDARRDREALATARAQVDEIAGLQRMATAPADADPRLALERVLAERDLRPALTSVEVKDSRTYVTFTAIGFDALVDALGALSKTGGLRPAEATLTTRVEPGTVRAEIVFTR